MIRLLLSAVTIALIGALWFVLSLVAIFATDEPTNAPTNHPVIWYS